MTRRKGQLRIIGGTWRSRRLQVPAGPALRPTPDRVRETLFNWLAPWIEGRRVLDLFAGSGALGLEALSRGAAAAVFVDASRTAVRALEGNIGLLGADTATVLCMDAMRYLERGGEAFDLVFVDPPYASGLVGPVLDCLHGARLLTPGARVYIEESMGNESSLAGHWRVCREVRAGAAHGRLLQLEEAD